MDIINDPLNPVGDKPGSVCLVRILVDPSKAEPLVSYARKWTSDFDDLSSPDWQDLQRALGRLKWLDTATLDLALEHCPDLGFGRSEILTGLVAMLHGPLSKINPLTYSRQNIYATIRNPLYTHFCG